MHKNIRSQLVAFLLFMACDIFAIPTIRTNIILRLPLLASYSMLDMHRCVQRINIQDGLGLSKKQIANYAYAALLVDHKSMARGNHFDTVAAQDLIDQELVGYAFADKLRPQVLSDIYNKTMNDKKFFADSDKHSLALFFSLWKLVSEAEKMGKKDIADYIEYKIIGDQYNQAHDVAIMLDRQGVLSRLPSGFLDAQCHGIVQDLIECAQYDDRRDVELFMYEYIHQNIQKN